MSEEKLTKRDKMLATLRGKSKPDDAPAIVKEAFNAIAQQVPDHSNTNVYGDVNVDGNVNTDLQPVKQELFEDRFSRQTFYIENDLVKALAKLTKKGGKGLKTRIINAALREYLNKQ